MPNQLPRKAKIADEERELGVVEAVPRPPALLGRAEREARREQDEPQAEAEREERAVAPALGEAAEHHDAADGAPDGRVREVEPLRGALAGVVGPEAHVAHIARATMPEPRACGQSGGRVAPAMKVLDGGKRGAVALGAVCMALTFTGCQEKRADPGAAECAKLTELAARSMKRWTAVNEASPAPEAPLGKVAENATELGKAAQEIGAAFAKDAPDARKRADLAESAEGVRMLGDLAGKRLQALGLLLGDSRRAAPGARQAGGRGERRLRRAGPRHRGEHRLREGRQGVRGGRRGVAEIDRVGLPSGFAAGAAASVARAGSMEGLARAVEAMPASPPKQKAREDVIRHARDAAAAFRALGKALDEAAPLEAHL